MRSAPLKMMYALESATASWADEDPAFGVISGYFLGKICYSGGVESGKFG